MSQINVTYCGRELINPFLVAASPSSDSYDKVRRAFEAGWAGAVLKTIEPAGKQRSLAEPNMGALDFQGRKQMAFYNYDLCTQQPMEELCREIEALKREYPDRLVIASLMAFHEEEWHDMIRCVEEAGADMIECSTSCPQGDENGRIPAADPALMERFTAHIRSHLRREIPLIVKLTPNVTDIGAVARSAAAGGADSLCAVDTVRGFIGLDVWTKTPKLHVDGRSALGGLSGPAIKPIALGCIIQIAQNTALPLAGVGGVSSWEDAAEFLLLGCRMVEVCTAISRYGFDMIRDLCDGLEQYLETQGYNRPEEIIGRALPCVVPQQDLRRDWHVHPVIDTASCRQCGLCVRACQDFGFGALSQKQTGEIALNKSGCRGCGVCRTVCPAGCLTLG